MTPLQVVVLVAGILALQLALWIPLLRWMRRKSAALADTLRSDIAASGERLILGPEGGLYRGASKGFPKVKGNAVLALTDRRLICHRLVGAPIVVPLDEVVGVREDKWFLRAYTGGRLHLILDMKDGAAVGFMAADHGRWMEAVRERIAGA